MPGRWGRRAAVPGPGTDAAGGGTGSTGSGAAATGRRAALADWAVDTVLGVAKFAGTVLAAGGAFYIGAKVALLGQPQRPPLSGRFSAVGSRLDQVAGLRCRTFYPADPAANSQEAPYLSEGTKTSDAMARLVFFPGFLLEHLAAAGSGCGKDAIPLMPMFGSKGYPLLVYSHGQGGNMDMGTYFLSQIASCGIVVVAVEHQDGSASTGDAGNPRPFSFGQGQLGVSHRAVEMINVAEALVSPGGLAEKLYADRECVLIGGHSYGGPTAIIAAAARPQLFRGLVLHDPALGSSMPRLTQPTFAIVGDQYANIPSLANEVRKVCAGAPAVLTGPGSSWAGAWHYVGISHGNFVDAPLWAPLIVMRALSLVLIPAAGPHDPAEAHQQMAEAAAAFAYSCSGRDTGSGSVVQPSLPFTRL